MVAFGGQNRGKSMVHGFCYYHYWFNGRRILERPLDEVLVSDRPALPFCVSWANESWTRAWKGHGDKVLLQQSYFPEDDLRHIQHVRRNARLRRRALFYAENLSLRQSDDTRPVWGCTFLANDRPSGSYPKTGVLSGLATIHPELAIFICIGHRNAVWPVEASCPPELPPNVECRRTSGNKSSRRAI